MPGMSDPDLEDEDLIHPPIPNELLGGMGPTEQRAVSIDRRQLGGEFIELSGHLAYWGDRYADAQVAKLRAEMGAKKLRRRIYLQLRSVKEKGDTETSLDARVETDPMVDEADELVLLRTAASLKLRSLVESIRTKGDMLVSLGAHQRAELKGDPMLRHTSREEG